MDSSRREPGDFDRVVLECGEKKRGTRVSRDRSRKRPGGASSWRGLRDDTCWSRMIGAEVRRVKGAFRIWDFGFRISDFGFGIADCGFRIWLRKADEFAFVDTGLVAVLSITCRNLIPQEPASRKAAIHQPCEAKSEIRNPQSEIPYPPTPALHSRPRCRCPWRWRRGSRNLPRR